MPKTLPTTSKNIIGYIVRDSASHWASLDGVTEMGVMENSMFYPYQPTPAELQDFCDNNNINPGDLRINAVADEIEVEHEIRIKFPEL